MLKSYEVNPAYNALVSTYLKDQRFQSFPVETIDTLLKELNNGREEDPNEIDTNQTLITNLRIIREIITAGKVLFQRD